MGWPEGTPRVPPASRGRKQGERPGGAHYNARWANLARKWVTGPDFFADMAAGLG
jgi:hypothetical protein